MKQLRKNLILASVGDDSRHPSWLSSVEPREFDLALIYYGNRIGKFRDDADHYFCATGFKYHLISDAIDQLGDSLRKYDFVWMPDDDIATSGDKINRLFAIAKQYDLEISQPAIASGDVSYRLLRQQAGFLLRYTRFVEVMCPLFSQTALQRVLSTFRENVSSWGIDWAWTRLVDERRIAVVDSVGVEHTRPLATGEAYRRFSERGVNPADECRQILKKYGLRSVRAKLHRRQVKYGTASCEAIDLSGRAVRVGPPWWRRYARAA
jgi:hypothetical protein